jgi:hypothetical protein
MSLIWPSRIHRGFIRRTWVTLRDIRGRPIGAEKRVLFQDSAYSPTDHSLPPLVHTHLSPLPKVHESCDLEPYYRISGHKFWSTGSSHDNGDTFRFIRRCSGLHAHVSSNARRCQFFAIAASISADHSASAV